MSPERIEQLELLKPVARVVNLVHVQQTSFAAHLHCNEVPPTAREPFRKASNISVSQKIQGENLLIVEADYSLKMTKQNPEPEGEDESETKIATLETHYVLVYTCPDVESFSTEQLGAFAELNGVHNLWPFLREFVQTALLRLNVTGVTVPTLQQLQRVAREAKESQAADAPE